jgi:hypothetical protein
MAQTTICRDLPGHDTDTVTCAVDPTPVIGDVTSALASLIARYREAHAAYEHHCRTVSEPADDRFANGKAAAEAAIPHVTMTIDMARCGTEMPAKTLTTANAIDVHFAERCAGYSYEPAELWTEDQHRYFAEERAFNTARIARDAEMQTAVQAARRASGIDAAQEAENALWDTVSAAQSAVVEMLPRSMADLTAKLAFYAESTAIPDHNDLLAQITSDVNAITAGVSNLTQMEG